MGKEVLTGSWWRYLHLVETAQCDLCRNGESSGCQGSPEGASDPALGKERLRKDGLKEVATKLKLKDEEHLARKTGGKDTPSRTNNMFKDSDSRGSSTRGAEHRSLWLKGGRRELSIYFQACIEHLLSARL